MNNRIVIIFVVLLMAALSACVSSPAAPAATETNAPTQTSPAEAPSASATPTADPDLYRIEEAGLSVKLPQGWSVLGPLETSSAGTPAYDLYIMGIEPAASGGPGSSKIVVADAGQWTPEQFVQAQCSTCPSQPFEEVILGGKSAQRTQVGGGDVPILVTWYFIENDGKLIALAIHDPESLEPLEDVLQSVQFD